VLLDGRAHRRQLANTTERSACGLINYFNHFRYADFVASVVHAEIFIDRDDGLPAVSMNKARCHIVMVSGWMHQMVKVSTLVMGKSILFV